MCNPLIAYRNDTELDQRTFLLPFQELHGKLITNAPHFSKEEGELLCKLTLLLSNGTDDKIEKAIDIYRKFNTQWSTETVKVLQRKFVQLIHQSLNQLPQLQEVQQSPLKLLHNLILLFETLKEDNPAKTKTHEQLVTTFTAKREILKKIPHPSFIDALTVYIVSSFLETPEKIWEIMPDFSQEYRFDVSPTELEDFHLAANIFVRLNTYRNEKQKQFVICVIDSFMKKLPEFVTDYTHLTRQNLLTPTQHNGYMSFIFTMLTKCLEVDHTLITPQEIIEHSMAVIHAQNQVGHEEKMVPENLLVINNNRKKQCATLAKQILEVCQKLTRTETTSEETRTAWLNAYRTVLSASR